MEIAIFFIGIMLLVAFSGSSAYGGDNATPKTLGKRRNRK